MSVFAYQCIYKAKLFFVLFCHIEISPLPKHSASCHALGIFGKLSMSRGALTWFETVWSSSVEAIDY
jgi:hypothetical protein